jgi:CRP/FNR family transcriptional regulator
MSEIPNVASLIARMKTVAHFKRMADADLEAIVNSGQIRRFDAGATIFREGDPCAGMFVLIAGHVHLYKLGPQGKQSFIAEFQPVIMFNEVPVLDGGANLTTAMAMQDCVTWNIGYENLQSILQRHPVLGLGLLRVLATRTRNLMAQYEDLSFRSVLARSAKLLLDLSDRGQRPINRKEHPNNEMAARIATVPEALSRSLNIFKKNGDIFCTRTTILVKQPETLEKFAQVGRAMFRG